MLKTLGWRLGGELPNEPKIILAGAPHTSNWDFIIAMAVILTTGIKLSTLMKEEAFIWPLSILWKWFGFIPTNRNSPTGIVGEVVSHFECNEKLWIGVTPEGTRGKTTQWKTGFLRIAHQADVPIVLMSLDYANKTWHFGRLFKATGDHNKDLAEIRDYFSNVTGKNPRHQG